MVGDSLVAAVGELLETDLECLDDAAVVAVTRLVETVSRRLPAVEHRLVEQLERRGVAGAHACRSTAAFLSQLLRIAPGAAAARVAAARDLGPRRGLDGQALAPIFPLVAAGQRDGVLAAGQARVITQALDRLPDEVLRANAGWLEQQLVDWAGQYHEGQLRGLASGLQDRLDPDGGYRDEPEQRRRRELNLRLRRDGMGELAGLLDGEATALVQAIFDALAAPAPAAEGMPDVRSPAQRRHDALRTAAGMVLRAGYLPPSGGITASVQFTISAEQVERAAPVSTSSGVRLSFAQACRLAADGLLLPVAFGDVGQLKGYGRLRRVATRAQRMALAARDGGCSFPGCTAPPAWCECHHVIAWQFGGRTDVEAMTLLCGYHHREFEARGWRVVMIDGLPRWIPPAWIDPSQTPRVNDVHHLDRVAVRALHHARQLERETAHPRCVAPSWGTDRPPDP